MNNPPHPNSASSQIDSTREHEAVETGSANEPSGAAAVGVASPGRFDSASDPFIGQWNQLVSTTNWEKGRIIHEWRQALLDEGAAAAEYSDLAWATKVGAVTAQHVGRLRRVYHRFHHVQKKYRGLYWSHFQASLDWDDAEMWLEGTVQNGWSVSRMRRQRWETLGADEAMKPRDEDIIVTELDEDAESAVNHQPAAPALSSSVEEVQGRPDIEGPDFGEEPSSSSNGDLGEPVAHDAPSASDAEVEYVRPFENLPEFPADLTEAFESFKLAIIRHKADGWSQISRDDTLASLDALKELALAPTGEKDV